MAPASACGSGSSRKFAQRTGLSITVCHFPPGTSKWNKVEHRLFSYIAMNWRAKPLVSLAAIVSLIGSTTTAAGLRIRSEIDAGTYPQGIAPTDPQMDEIDLERHTFHGDWNYTFHPAASERNKPVISCHHLLRLANDSDV